MDLESPQNESKSAGDFVEGFWSYVGNFAEKNRFKITVFLRIFAAISYNCYLVAAVYNGHLKQLDIDWCGGVGMLIILTVIVYCGLFYYKVFKPHWGDSAYSRVILPLTLILERCWSYRFLRLLVIAGGVAGFTVGLVLDTAGDRDRLYSLIGLAVFLLFGWIFSKHPSQIKWTQVIWGMILQFLFGLMVLRWKTGQQVFACLGDRVSIFLKYTDAGSGLVYGHLVTDQNDSGIPLGTIFAFKALSVIFLFSFMVNILYYYGVMQLIVQKVGWFLQVSVGTTATESINCAANIFLGQTEAPLAIKPLLPLLTKSELHTVMTSGFATISGSVLSAYISFGISASHLLSASVMSAPAALSFAKLFYPETEESQTKAEDIKVPKGKEANALDAAAQGASNAVFMVINICANLIAFLAFIAFLNGIISWMGGLLGAPYVTFEYLVGKCFIPLAWIMGIPAEECDQIGHVVALKTIVNEFVAYRQLSEYMAKGLVSKRSETIATFALCGFSNPGSIGIQIAALGSMAPSRQTDLAQVAFRAFVSGSIACFMTACVAGTLIPSSSL
ncbi:solute carrier family 28 member 3-like [Daphnia pulicaria]|uniref:solute carrier family 28 member 3-like n=1 Tax=Daphnia pulicaria TaxID=35523 RepID=UPI001EEAA716|nr:solute carrier family 28 member 3-like [Daphnia pulicaria]